MENQIKVAANAGLIDSVQAAVRYIVVIISFITALLGLLKVHDIAGIMNLIQSNGGEVFAAIVGLIGLVTAGYGIVKTWKRGAQVATVAADPEVPDHVATLK